MKNYSRPWTVPVSERAQEQFGPTSTRRRPPGLPFGLRFEFGRARAIAAHANRMRSLRVAAGVALAILTGGPSLAQQSGVKVPRPLPITTPMKESPPDLPPAQPMPERPHPSASLPLRTETPKKAGPDIVPQVRPMRDPNTVYYSAPGDGRIWARGTDYKASFGTDGARFIPCFGASAPHDYPVSFEIDSIDVGAQPIAFDRGVAASRTSDTIRFDRAGVIEAYALTPAGMEQSFVFEQLPVGGDLVVRLRVQSELTSWTCADELRFSNELGFVNYGRAHVCDAAGKCAPAPTALVAGGIEIRVPAGFLASAVFPVIIDPLVSSFGVDTSVRLDSDPDVAYVAACDRYLVVYAEKYSSNDIDVFSAFVGPTGAVTWNNYIDFTTDTWLRPKVASNNIAHNFMVVADVVVVGSTTDSYIRGATVDCASGNVGPQFEISTGDQGDIHLSADIGGDATWIAPTYYLVSWTANYPGGPVDYDVYARLVRSDGQLLGTGPIYVDFSTANDESATISKSDGREPFATQRWTIAWRRGSGQTNVWGAQYAWDGALVHSSFPIDQAFTESAIQVSSLLDGSGERDYMVAYDRYIGFFNNDVHARIMNGTNVVSDASITALEGQGFGPELQQVGDVDSDGDAFIIGYREQYGTSATDFDVYVASVACNGITTQVAERHVNLDFSGLASGAPHLTSTYSGGGAKHRSMLVWDDYTTTQSDVFGGFYDAGTFASFCSPGTYFDQVLPCPCGNPSPYPGTGCNNSTNTGGAVLTATGTASLASDTVSFTANYETPNGLSIFMQGNAPIFEGIAFGQGVRCVGGALRRLYTHAAPGGFVSAPVGTDASVHARSAALGDAIGAGSARYYFVFYRDAVVLGGCSPALTFNTTQSGSLIWHP